MPATCSISLLFSLLVPLLSAVVFSLILLEVLEERPETLESVFGGQDFFRNRVAVGRCHRKADLLHALDERQPLYAEPEEVLVGSQLGDEHVALSRVHLLAEVEASCQNEGLQSVVDAVAGLGVERTVDVLQPGVHDGAHRTEHERGENPPLARLQMGGVFDVFTPKGTGVLCRLVLRGRQLRFHGSGFRFFARLVGRNEYDNQS